MCVLSEIFSVTRVVKVAEHSFLARKDCKKINMASFYLLNASAICTISPHNWTKCFDGFSLLSEMYVRKGNDAKNSAIRRFFFVIERTQLNAAHA